MSTRLQMVSRQRLFRLLFLVVTSLVLLSESCQEICLNVLVQSICSKHEVADTDSASMVNTARMELSSLSLRSSSQVDVEEERSSQEGEPMTEQEQA